MGAAPGQRTVMVISPGFFTIDPLFSADKNEILDRAIRANVIINGMDARGLYTDPAFECLAARQARRLVPDARIDAVGLTGRDGFRHRRHVLPEQQ
jgi:hypothetical protein